MRMTGIGTPNNQRSIPRPIPVSLHPTTTVGRPSNALDHRSVAASRAAEHDVHCPRRPLTVELLNRELGAWCGASTRKLRSGEGTIYAGSSRGIRRARDLTLIEDQCDPEALG